MKTGRQQHNNYNKTTKGHPRKQDHSVSWIITKLWENVKANFKEEDSIVSGYLQPSNERTSKRTMKQDDSASTWVLKQDDSASTEYKKGTIVPVLSIKKKKKGR